jgi:hypothetical protein
MDMSASLFHPMAGFVNAKQLCSAKSKESAPEPQTAHLKNRGIIVAAAIFSAIEMRSCLGGPRQEHLSGQPPG